MTDNNQPPKPGIDFDKLDLSIFESFGMKTKPQFSTNESNTSAEDIILNIHKPKSSSLKLPIIIISVIIFVAVTIAIVIYKTKDNPADNLSVPGLLCKNSKDSADALLDSMIELSRLAKDDISVSKIDAVLDVIDKAQANLKEYEKNVQIFVSSISNYQPKERDIIYDTYVKVAKYYLLDFEKAYNDALIDYLKTFKKVLEYQSQYKNEIQNGVQPQRSTYETYNFKHQFSNKTYQAVNSNRIKQIKKFISEDPALGAYLPSTNAPTWFTFPNS
ncbi:MAG: hypothetical protein HQK77_00685 [Desulfobacterales bacterium]|nr:hypothetical protein [Desulfobacterales bacterium]